MSEAIVIIALGLFMLRPPWSRFDHMLGAFMIIYGCICAIGELLGGQL